jgi:hypothetical protein
VIFELALKAPGALGLLDIGEESHAQFRKISVRLCVSLCLRGFAGVSLLFSRFEND